MVVPEISGLLRPTVRGKIGRTGAGNPAHRPEPQGYQTAVLQLTDPQCNVDIGLKQIQQTVDEDQLEVYVRIFCEKLQDNRDEVRARTRREP